MPYYKTAEPVGVCSCPACTTEAVTDPDTGIVYFPDDDAPNPYRVIDEPPPTPAEEEEFPPDHRVDEG